MEGEELLAEARRRYPVGTKYWNLNMAGGKSDPIRDPKECPKIPPDVKFSFGDTKGSDGKPVVLVTNLKNGHTLGWVHANGCWAEHTTPKPITPKLEIINTYLIF